MQIDILALAGSSLGGLAATGDVLDAANRLGADPRFTWRIVSTASGVDLRQGVRVAAERLSHAHPAPIIVVLGLGAGGPEEIEARIARSDAAAAARWLRRAHDGGAVVATSCTGAFLLAEAGLLDGRDCTTSWWLQGLLARRAPEARVQADAMVVTADRVWTAGPAYAHLDLMLELVTAFASSDLAQAAARRLTADRRTHQAAYIDPASMGVSPLVASVETLVGARLSTRVSLNELAELTGCSPRTLARRIQSETGLPPMRFVQKVRLDAALRLIREGELPLAQVAERVGLADAATLHRLVVRHTNRAPGSFRAA